MNEQINSPGWATYLRVSDEDKQTPERSFAMQRQRIQEHLLASSDLPFKCEYFDILTGTSPNRVDYQRMLADAASGSFSHLALYRADRFGRNTVEGLQAATRLIGQGIKIRVAHMPSLRPEEPDGFFMFLIQMGLAQREVDVLKQRASDGMAAKMRAGGWSQKAPEGYLNKERLVKSGKYERWVEPDPFQVQALRHAWDLLLTDRYTLDQICDELNRMGYTRPHGYLWAWTDPNTGQRRTAKNRLHEIFHKPFYAGWCVSEKFGIPMGEIRGIWEPVVTTEEFEKGVEILRKHDLEKSREKRQFYLLRNLLYVEISGKQYKMFGSTPSGRSKSYAYYITHNKPDGSKLHLPCEQIDSQMPDWLQGIAINPIILPAIRESYESQIANFNGEERAQKREDLKRRVSQLREGEVRLGRLLMSDEISEESYSQLRKEWQEKVRQAEANLRDLEQHLTRYLNDLDIALLLLAKASDLYLRLDEKKRAILLQILVKRIIVNSQGEIMDQELNSPFAYLRSLVEDFQNQELCGSEEVRSGS